jgi:cyclohexanone monooxygenase
MGLAMAGFPNLFMITGPQSPSVKTQMILGGEQHTEWIAEFLEYMRLNGFTRFDVEQQAEDAWVLHNNDIADSTLYPLANSWYVGANVPGKPRVFMPYVGGFDRYKRACDELARNGYPGLQLSSRGQTLAAAD